MNDAMLEVVHGRHNALIDPSLQVWGWEIPVYLFLGGLAAGVLILPALMELLSGAKARSTPSAIVCALSAAPAARGSGAGATAGSHGAAASGGAKPQLAKPGCSRRASYASPA